MLAKLLGGKIVLVLSVAVLMGLTPTPSYAARNGLDALSRDLDRAGRDLCRSLKLKCRSTRAAKTRKLRTARKQKSVAALPVQKPVKVVAVEPAGKVSVSVSAPPETPVIAKAAKTDAPVVLALAPKIAARLEAETLVDKNVTVINPAARTEPPLPKVDMKLASLEPGPKTVAKIVAEPPKKKKAAKAEAAKPKTTKLAAIVTTDLPPVSADETCLASLRNSKVEFEKVPTPPSEKNCAVDTPVKLSAIMTKTGKVTLPDQPILSCTFARQFALWLSDTGAATVATQLNAKLAKVRTGPGFECRNRNGDGSGKLSEHAFGNAVDITTIATADGKKYEVAAALDQASTTQPALRGLRRSACGYFSTVLGPGANAAHAAHFHFDMATEGRGKNYRICQ